MIKILIANIMKKILSSNFYKKPVTFLLKRTVVIILKKVHL